MSTIVDDTARARIDSTLQHSVDHNEVAGISALIFEKDEEVYFNAFGKSVIEKETPMDRNSIIQIYSMTKPVTGVALMQLYEKGAFALDDPVAKYIPEFRNLQVYAGIDSNGNLILESPGREMTIRDLTRHTAGFIPASGVPVLSDLRQEADLFDPDITLSEMGERLADLPLWFHPGEKWSYGVSVDVQALLVEQLSEKSFGEYLQEHIFDPLNMTETRYFVPENDRDRLAMIYQKDDKDGSLIPADEPLEINIRKAPLTPGGFGLTSTLDDYMNFARMLVNEGELEGVRILQPETVRLMATNHLSDDVTERSWLPTKGNVGFGINFAVRIAPPSSPEENPGVVGEFFWDGYASTLFWVDPENELTAVLFLQLLPFDAAGLHRSFRSAVYGK